MIDLRQMRYFVALGDTLHFGRAAARLNLTQPPLSRQIAALEVDLGVTLVLRRPRSLALTEAGRAFLVECRGILARVDAACVTARRIGRGELGELSLGFMIHAAQTIAAGLASRFMLAHPDVAMRLSDMLPSTLHSEVVAGRIDAGILFALKPTQGLSMLPVFAERLCCALPVGHPLSALPVVPASALQGLPFVATRTEVSPPLRETIAAYCQTAGFVPNVQMEVQLQQTILSLVGEGIGVAIVPQSLATPGLSTVLFRPLENAPFVENMLIWRSDNGNPALQSLIAMIPPLGAPR